MKIKIIMLILLVFCATLAGYKTNESIKLKASIFAAVRSGDPAQIQAALDKGVKLSTRDGAGQTPLHVAAYKGIPEIVELLISKGAKTDAKDNTDGTPLHWAAIKGKVENCEILISAGADVNALDKTGNTPLHWLVAGRGVIDVKRFVTASYLLNKKANPNIKNEQGRTPLDIAEQKKDDVMINLLNKVTDK